jgi:hypothetical protein
MRSCSAFNIMKRLPDRKDLTAIEGPYPRRQTHWKVLINNSRVPVGAYFDRSVNSDNRYTMDGRILSVGMRSFSP